MDGELFDSPDATEVAAGAFSVVVEGCPEGKDFDAYIASLPRPWRVIYTTFWLDCEVNNGGFHQFFWNTEGRWNRETEKDLETIRAEPFLELFREAKKIFEAHDYVEEKVSSGNSLEGFSVAYKEKRMGELESVYFKQKKKLPEFVGEYLKQNRALYEK